MLKKIAFSLIFFVFEVHAETEITIASSPPRVVISGGKTDAEAGRDFIAGKIVIGKLRIAESGAQNAGELLRREPAVSIGKDGRIGLLGLQGYTQVLVDGKPYSGDPFSIDLVHVEKIEIIKTTTATTGPLGTAGTINIIRKKTERQAYANLRIGGSGSAGRLGADIAWSNNQVVADGPFSYNVSFSASHKPTSSESRYVQTRQGGALALETQFDGNRTARGVLQTVTARTDLVWAVDANHKISFSPDAARINVTEDSVEQRRQISDQGFSIQQKNVQPLLGYSLPLRWDWRIDDDSYLAVKLSANRSRLNIDPSRTESWSDGVMRQRNEREMRRMDDCFLDIDFNTEISGGHEITAGAKFVSNDQQTTYADFIDGQANAGLTALGTHSAIRLDSGRVFVQDEWRLDRTLAFNLGISAERRVYRLKEGAVDSRNRFNMWSPSAHLSKKIKGNSQRQIRLSLAQSYQTPSLSQLLLHPAVNIFVPCPYGQRCSSNTPDTADTGGNPYLQPERTLGLNLSYTHGLGRDSELALEFYSRNIQKKIGFDLRLENVPWASVPRYIYRPVNLGQATIQGINLEGRLSGKEMWGSASDMELHGSLGWAQSELDDLPRPDNRVAGQTPWSAKLGGSYTLQGAPVKLGLDTSYLPGDWLRNNLSEHVYQSSRLTLNASANWKISSKTKLMANLDGSLYKTSKRIDEYSGAAESISRLTYNTLYPRVTIRLEKTL